MKIVFSFGLHEKNHREGFEFLKKMFEPVGIQIRTEGKNEDHTPDYEVESTHPAVVLVREIVKNHRDKCTTFLGYKVVPEDLQNCELARAQYSRGITVIRGARNEEMDYDFSACNCMVCRMGPRRIAPLKINKKPLLKKDLAVVDFYEGLIVSGSLRRAIEKANITGAVFEDVVHYGKWKGSLSEPEVYLLRSDNILPPMNSSMVWEYRSACDTCGGEIKLTQLQFEYSRDTLSEAVVKDVNFTHEFLGGMRACYSYLRPQGPPRELVVSRKFIDVVRRVYPRYLPLPVKIV